jgi:hypothetical protein
MFKSPYAIARGTVLSRICIVLSLTAPYPRHIEWQSPHASFLCNYVAVLKLAILLSDKYTIWLTKEELTIFSDWKHQRVAYISRSAELVHIDQAALIGGHTKNILCHNPLLKDTKALVIIWAACMPVSRAPFDTLGG